MTDEQYIELMKRLRPNVIISPELIRMFREAYPPHSFKLRVIQAQLGMIEILQKHSKKAAK